MSHLLGTPFPVAPLRRFVIELTDGPFGSSLTSSHYSEYGARVIRLGNIGSAEFKSDDEAYIPLDYFNYLRRHEVTPGDLIIAGLGDQKHPVGRACVAPTGLGPAIVKADCFRARLDESRLLHRYSAWALSSSAISQQILTLTRGTTRARINLDLVRDIELPVPPIEEQRRIADFLDTETGRMDRLANSQLRLTHLIKEREETAVDQTLRDAASRMIRLKHLLEAPPSYGANEAAEHRRRDWPRYIRTTDITEDGGLREETFASLPPEAARPYLLDDGDLLFVRSGATAGKSFLYRSRFGPAAHAGYLIRARVNHEIVLPRLIWYFSRTPTYWQQISEGTIQATIQNVNAEKYGNLLTPYMEPSRQASTLRELDSLTEWSRKVKQRAHRLLDLLAERRQALITAAVTGQFDVSTAGGRNVTEGVSA